MNSAIMVYFVLLLFMTALGLFLSGSFLPIKLPYLGSSGLLWSKLPAYLTWPMLACIIVACILLWLLRSYIHRSLIYLYNICHDMVLLTYMGLFTPRELGIKSDVCFLAWILLFIAFLILFLYLVERFSLFFVIGAFSLVPFVIWCGIDEYNLYTGYGSKSYILATNGELMASIKIL